jgi:hypothetical protein
MKRYSIIQAPVLSFFSKALYRDVRHKWTNVGYGYLVLLLMACWIAPTVKLHYDFSGFVDNEAPKIVTQIPKLTITDGKASIDEPQPYSIVDPDSGVTIVVIDTTGSIRSLDETDAHILITETTVIYKKNEIQTDTFDLSEIDEFTLTQDMINGWLETAKSGAVPVIYVGAVLGSFIFRILQSLIYACIGLLFASWCKTNIGYATLIRLSVIAVTPGIIVATILETAGIDFPYSGWCYFLAAMGYLFFGIKTSGDGKVPLMAPVAPPIMQPIEPTVYERAIDES